MDVPIGTKISFFLFLFDEKSRDEKNLMALSF